jgi:hypothetical protein
MAGWSSKASVEVERRRGRGLKAGGGRRETPGKVLRIGVHHANGVVWEPVYRTTLSSGVRCLRHHVAPAPASFPSPPPPPPAPPPLVLRFRGFDAEGAGSPRSARLISAKSSSISSRVSVSWNVGWLAPARRGGLSDVSCGAQKYDGRCFGAVGSPRSHFVSSWRRNPGVMRIASGSSAVTGWDIAWRVRRGGDGVRGGS